MSKAALMKLYGKKLKPYSFRQPVKPDPESWEYSIDTPEVFCGGNFDVVFTFDEYKPKRGLVAVQLELEKGKNADGRVGDCVLKEYTEKYGHPRKRVEAQGPGQYAFSGARVILYIFPGRVSILYRGPGCRWWEFNCNSGIIL